MVGLRKQSQGICVITACGAVSVRDWCTYRRTCSPEIINGKVLNMFEEKKIRERLSKLFVKGFSHFSCSDFVTMINNDVDPEYRITDEERDLMYDIFDGYRQWTAKMFLLNGFDNKALAKVDEEDFFKITMYQYLSYGTEDKFSNSDFFQRNGEGIKNLGGVNMKLKRDRLKPLGLVMKKILLGTCEAIYPGMYSEQYKEQIRTGEVYY